MHWLASLVLLNASDSKEVEQVVLKVLSKDPQQRFASVADFAKALASVR